jgi:PBSX family phage terminase large subunit
MIQLTDKQNYAAGLISDAKAAGAREILLYGGARSAKSFLLFYLIFLRACRLKKTRHLLLRQTFIDCRQSLLLDTVDKVLRLACSWFTADDVDKRDWYLTLPNGSEIWFGGIDDKKRLDKILGREFSSVFFDEASQISYKSYNYVKTRLSSKDSEKKMIFLAENPPSKWHWTYRRFVEGKCPETKKDIDKSKVCCMQMNPVDNLENIDDEYLDLLKTLPEAEQKRFLRGEFSDDIVGGVYADQLEAAVKDGRICPVTTVNAPVHAAFDVGFNDSTSIFIFQFSDDKIHILDYLEDFGRGAESYLAQIKNKGYNLHTLVLPHDVANNNWGTGHSAVDEIYKLKSKYNFARILKIDRTKRMVDDINLVRATFASIKIDVEKCEKALSALGHYRYEYNEKTLTYDDSPAPDWCRHAADAMRYLCVGAKMMRQISAPDFFENKKEEIVPRSAFLN